MTIIEFTLLVVVLCNMSIWCMMLISDVSIGIPNIELIIEENAYVRYWGIVTLASLPVTLIYLAWRY